MNRGVFITGYSGGIGKALVASFKEAGWQVAGIDLTESSPIKSPFFYKASVSDPQVLEKIRDEFKEKKFPLTCIINNAAIQLVKPFIETTLEEWNNVLAANVSSVFLTTKFLSILLPEGGSIINISSVHARATSPGMAAYVASKGAVSALSRALSLELAPKGIRVNALLPGATNTLMLKEGLRRSTDPHLARKHLESMTPLKRVAEGHEIASLALFLADSDKSGFITGQEFICDGGVLAKLATE